MIYLQIKTLNLFKKFSGNGNRRISNLNIDEIGFTVPWALNVVVNGDDVQWYISDFPILDIEGGAAVIKIRKTTEGYEALFPSVRPGEKIYDWTPVETPDKDWMPIVVFVPAY